MLADIGAGDEINLALLTVHPHGLRPYISNWHEAAPAFVRRLRSEAVSARDPEVQARVEALVALADLGDDDAPCER